MAYTTFRWIKWGLCLDDSLDAEAWRTATRDHELVADYLERHAETAAAYRADQRGAVKYFDVLKLAEIERGTQERS